MNTIYNLENRLHQEGVSLPLLSGFYQEYLLSTGALDYYEQQKISREFAHIYLELTNSVYQEGDLN